jgi:hypothetical protein
MNLWKVSTIIFGISTAALSVAFLTLYYDAGSWNVQEGAHLATIAGTFVVAGSIVIIARQLQVQSAQMEHQGRQAELQAEQAKLQAEQAELQTRLAKASNSQSFVSISSNFVLSVASNADLMAFWQNTGATYDTATDDVKARYAYLVQWWLTFYENLVHQNDAGLLDAVVFRAWEDDMKGFVKRRHVEKLWDSVSDRYSTLFISHFQPIIDARRSELAAEAAAGSPPPAT